MSTAVTTIVGDIVHSWGAVSGAVQCQIEVSDPNAEANEIPAREVFEDENTNTEGVMVDKPKSENLWTKRENEASFGREKSKIQASGMDTTNTEAIGVVNLSISAQLVVSHPLTPAPQSDSLRATPLTSTAPLISGSATEAEPLKRHGGGSSLLRAERPKTSRHQHKVFDREEPKVVHIEENTTLLCESSSSSSSSGYVRCGGDITEELPPLGSNGRSDDIIAHRRSARGRQPERRPAALPLLVPRQGDLARHRPEITWDSSGDGQDQSGLAAGGSTCHHSSTESRCCADGITCLDHTSANVVNVIKEELNNANINHNVIEQYKCSSPYLFPRNSIQSNSNRHNQKDIKNSDHVRKFTDKPEDINSRPSSSTVCHVSRFSLRTAVRSVQLLFSQQLTVLLTVLLFAHVTLPHSDLIIGAAAATTTAIPNTPASNTTLQPDSTHTLLSDSTNLPNSAHHPSDTPHEPSDTPHEPSDSSHFIDPAHQPPDSPTSPQLSDSHLLSTDTDPVDNSDNFLSNAAYIKDSSYLLQSPKCPCGVRNFTATRPDLDRTFLFYLTPASISRLEVLLPVEVTLNLTHYRKPKSAAITNPLSNIPNDNIQPEYQTDATTNSTARHKRSALEEKVPRQKSKSLHYERETFLGTSKSLLRERKSPRNQQNHPTASSGEDKDEEEFFCVMVYSNDADIAAPFQLQINVHWGVDDAHVCQDPSGQYLLMAVTAGRQHNFSVEARSVGRVTMSVATVDVDGTSKLSEANSVYAVASTQYSVTAVRGERTADLVFNSAAAAIAIVISFGIGACTDMDSLKRQLKNPVALIIGFCCQFIIMPVIAFGIAMALPLDKDIRFGLLCNACVPGGGLSHVAVIIAGGDTGLSLSINLIAVIAMLGTAPLWMFVLGQYFQHDSDNALSPRSIPLHKFELWLAATFFAFAAGLMIKKIWPAVADNILMWLIKPFLLLAAILYITLGVYINMYVFELVKEYALLGAALLPLCGCIVGGVTATICRQSYTYVKTIALETSSLNCLVVMVALRYTLPQPDADLAAMIPIWVMFTIPGLFVALAICTKVKDTLIHYWRNRNSSKEEIQGSCKAYSVSSSVVSPPGTTTLSAPLVVADALDDDATISTASNQKVTVL